ncbi:multiple epidermal growth factor-like domains protein 8, partial [Pyrgilauda ruficollis]|uniref:multiple epidermal growth factor-like domains protein 8 n=1 Tax=Pyrgilauda ruficollis TaxID=221976 RepID=UPI001B8654C9
GNVHTHYHEEKCYEEGLHFYHLRCHRWSPGHPLETPNEPGSPGGGRYSHVSGVLAGQVLLVAGGFSGTPRGDLRAYKVPSFVLQRS